MKSIIFVGALFFAAVVSDIAMAGMPPPPPPSCSTGKRVQLNDIATTLQNKLVCGRKPVVQSGNDKWSEEHVGGGALFEYAQGPDHAVDSRRSTGTWGVGGGPSQNTGLVVYTYSGAGGTYSWSLWQEGTNSVRFCSADGLTTIATATLLAIPSSGPNPCP